MKYNPLMLALALTAVSAAAAVAAGYQSMAPTGNGMGERSPVFRAGRDRLR